MSGLKRSSLWMMGGSVIFAISQWLILMILAQWGGTQSVGLYSLALAITAPVIVFSNLGLRSVQASDRKNEHTFDTFRKLRVLTLTIAFIVLLFIASRYQMEAFFIILIITLSKVFESMSDLIYGLAQKNERMDFIAKSMITRGIAGILTLTTVLFLTNNLILALSAFAASWLIAYIQDTFRTRRLIKDEKSGGWKELSNLFITALPLGISALFTSLLTNIPRYFIEGQVGLAELGIYAAMVQFITVGSILIISIAQTLMPRLAKFFSEGDLKAYFKLTAKGAILAGGLGFAGFILSLFIGEWILRTLYGEEFAQNMEVFYWIIATAPLQYITTIQSYSFQATRKFKSFAWISGTSVAVILISSTILIPTHGLLGAAWSMMITYGVRFVLYGILQLKLVKN